MNLFAYLIFAPLLIYPIAAYILIMWAGPGWIQAAIDVRERHEQDYAIL